MPAASSLPTTSPLTWPLAAKLANNARSPYTVNFTPAARRKLVKLPLSAAAALYEHLTGPVAGNPHRLGKPLDEPFHEVWTTRRGDYRALYSIDEDERTITVLAVAHRRDAYRPH